MAELRMTKLRELVAEMRITKIRELMMRELMMQSTCHPCMPGACVRVSACIERQRASLLHPGKQRAQADGNRRRPARAAAACCWCVPGVVLQELLLLPENVLLLLLQLLLLLETRLMDQLLLHQCHVHGITR